MVALSPHRHSASFPSLAPPLLPHSQSGTSAHSSISTRKLFRATPAHPALQLLCFSYMAIHHVCVFHDEGLCFHNWIRAAPRQGSSPASAGLLGGDMGGPLHAPFTLSPPFLPSIPILLQSRHGKERPGFSLFSPSLCPAMFFFVGALLFHSVMGRMLPFDPQNLTVLHGKLVTQRPSFWI